MLFSTVGLLWLYTWANKTKQSRPLAWLVLFAAIGLFIYTPGIIWLVLACAVICRKKLLAASSDMSRFIWFAGPILSLIIIFPLVSSGISHPDSIKQLLLIPSSWASAIEIAKNTAWGVAAIFLRAKTLWLGALAIYGIIAAGINDNIIFLALGLPAFAIFISAGLRYLYIEWRTIFPRNPVPKTFALLLIAAVVFSQIYYGVMYSLVAWPHTAATRQVYVLK
jgi:hypothetical protein